MTAPAMETPPNDVDDRPGFLTRWSDRLNPILVRELQQAFSARAFMFVIALALLAILVFALVVALQGEHVVGDGRDVFTAVLMVMAPVLMLTLPMQAFNSMQVELREGAIDQLQMSELSPRRIVRGKLLAISVLIAMFLAVFAPLLAVTYLLRGVDIPTILVSLALAILFALGAAAVGMAAGAITAIKPLQQIARVGVSFALAAMTIGSIGAMYELVREASRSNFDEIVATVAGLLVGVVFMCQIASAILTHPYENRSTPFRVFAMATTLLGFVMAWALARPTDLAEAGPGVMMAVTFCMIPFAIAWVTEPRELSPRVRTLVPRRSVLALLAAPFLPGSDRGLLFMLVLWAVGAAGMFLLPALVGRVPHGSTTRFVLLVIPYVIIYAVTMRILRGNGPGARPRMRALLLTSLLLVGACVAPLLFDLFAYGSLDHWHMGHVLNPFFTIGDFAWRGNDTLTVVLWILAAVLLATRVPGMIRGVREVMEASRARRG